jgi:hypothetical protein
MNSFMISSQMYITNHKSNTFNLNKLIQSLLLFDIPKRGRRLKDLTEKEVKYGVFVQMRKMIELYSLLLMLGLLRLLSPIK